MQDAVVYELVYPNSIALSIDRSTGVITLRETIGDDVETTVNVSSDQLCDSAQTTCLASSTVCTLFL